MIFTRVHEPNDRIRRLLWRAAGNDKVTSKGNTMRKSILIAASALALASPAAAADLTVPPPYSQGPSYHRETHTYEDRTAPGIEEAAPPVVVQRPVVVAPPPVVVEEYPVYAAPRVYAYGGPVWGRPGWGWGHRHHFHDGW